MSDLLALADEIERAAEGSRELDARIHESAVGLRMYESIHERGGDLCLRYYPGTPGPEYGRLPRYTTSLEAARTLGNGLLCVFASDIGADGQPLVKLVADTTTSPIIEHSGIAATLEMAWCAAILRARQTEPRHDES